jgi:CubicO group peptidase (beta-lactamase class C family)
MTAFPSQPLDVSWPTVEWPTGDPGPDIDAERLDSLIARAMAQPDDLGLTLALLVVRHGRIVAEAYGPDTDASSTLISWSMAKSMTQAVFGLLVGDGRIGLDDPAPVAAWAADGRREITIRQLLEMSSGLRFVEDYVDDSVSDVIEMLFGRGADDHAAFAASFPLEHPPGAVWNYASGTTNILAHIAGDLVGGGRDGMERFLRERLFDPIGMRSASPKFDTAGTFVGSSYVYATARDFARFGTLYLRDGVWEGERLLPEGWADLARTPTAAEVPADERHGYGSHWWRWLRSSDTFSANGFETQRIIVSPARDLVLVRLGKTPAEHGPDVDELLDDLLNLFPAA